MVTETAITAMAATAPDAVEGPSMRASTIIA
jgi:hypothetical protein